LRRGGSASSVFSIRISACCIEREGAGWLGRWRLSCFSFIYGKNERKNMQSSFMMERKGRQVVVYCFLHRFALIARKERILLYYISPKSLHHISHTITRFPAFIADVQCSRNTVSRHIPRRRMIIKHILSRSRRSTSNRILERHTITNRVL
jgi:hypothetical protein